MLKSLSQSLSKPFLWGLLVLVLLLTFSLSLRQHDFKQGVGAQNLEATYHVLLTVNALNESSVTNHWFLPTVSLGGERDKYIPWGATVPTKTGDYIYTSFTPPGFLAPYAAFAIIDVKPSVKNLSRFNFALGTIASVVLFILLWRLLSFIGYSPWTSIGGALVGSSIGIFSRESLLSHGVIYWSQSLYQVLLVTCLWFVFKYLSTDSSSEKRTKYAFLIVAIAFFGALTEWTGYIFNFGLALLFWIGFRETDTSKLLAIRIFIATVVAAIFTVIHYAAVVGFQSAIMAFLGRFLARNVSSGNFIGLAQGYILSYGFFLVALIDAFSIYCFLKIKKPVISSNKNILFFVFVAASLPLIENIVMLQHATQFSFDRLKFVFPAAIVLASSFCRLNIKWRGLFGVIVVLSCIQGYKSYKNDMNTYTAWTEIDTANKKLATQIKEKVDMSCSVFLSNINVRGYANLLIHRGIYEYHSDEKLFSLIEKRDGCAAVYLDGTSAFPDLPKYTKATVTYKNGSTISFVDGEVLHVPGQIHDSSFLTD